MSDRASCGRVDHRMIRVATSPTARKATTAHPGALVGAGAALPGAPDAGVPPRARVPEREPNILHSTSTLISPLLPFS
jgi:hypothetical protein